jgi:hypothetical protein
MWILAEMLSTFSSNAGDPQARLPAQIDESPA